MNPSNSQWLEKYGRLKQEYTKDRKVIKDLKSQLAEQSKKALAMEQSYNIRINAIQNTHSLELKHLDLENNLLKSALRDISDANDDMNSKRKAEITCNHLKKANSDLEEQNLKLSRRLEAHVEMVNQLRRTESYEEWWNFLKNNVHLKL